MNINNSEILKAINDLEKTLKLSQDLVIQASVDLKVKIIYLIEKENELINVWNKAVKGCGIALMELNLDGWKRLAKQENIMAVIFPISAGFEVFSVDPEEMPLVEDKYQLSYNVKSAVYADYSTAHYHTMKTIKHYRNKV